MGDDRSRDDENRDSIFGGLARGLRDFFNQIADPIAPSRPQPVSAPGRRPPRVAPRTTNAAGAREPVVDIFDEGEMIRVVADMPGADPDTLRVKGAGNRLAIAAGGEARRYERIITLPKAIIPERASPPTLINGIMETLLPIASQQPERAIVPQSLPETAHQRSNGEGDGADG